MANVYVPDDYTDLRQIFDVYRALLKTNGILAHARNVRAVQKSNGGTVAHGTEYREPVYKGEAHTALERCGNLPVRGYLEDEAVLHIRGGRPRVLPPPAMPPPQPEDEEENEEEDEEEEQEEEEPPKKKSILSLSLITGKMGKFKIKGSSKKKK